MSDHRPRRTGWTIRESATIRGASPILLAAAPHLAALGRKARARLAGVAECQLLRPGSVAYWQGEPAEHVFVLLDGEIMLQRRDTRRGGDLRHDLCLSGTFGDFGLLGEDRRYYTASSVAVSLLLRVPWSPLRGALDEHPEVRDAWIDEVLLRVYRKGVRTRHGPRDPFVAGRGETYDRALAG